MSPQEFLELNTTFEQKLREVCEREGLSLIVQPQNPHLTLFIINTENYLLLNNGNKAMWKFIGKSNV